MSKTKRKIRFAVISSCPETWGGSEELWFGAAENLLLQGHTLNVFKTNVDYQHPRIQRLTELGCTTQDIWKMGIPLPHSLRNRIVPDGKQLTGDRISRIGLKWAVRFYKPDFVIIAQGANFDGCLYAEICRKMGLPYIMICQKAFDEIWPKDDMRVIMRKVFESAVWSFFVSQHNLKLTEEQIGVSIENAEVVRNPFAVPFDVDLPYPNSDTYKLACVARLWLMDKGQDILLRVLSKPKWQERNIRVSFFGKGVNQESLMSLTSSLGVRNVDFIGHVDNVSEIWETHHALVLPSRNEGLPLVLVEAMLCGRTAIATKAGGIPEVLTDGETGFLAEGANVEAFDRALERAWEARNSWHDFGNRAKQCIRNLISPDPIRDFTNRLTDLVKLIIEQL
jgi:glycosyltransferase involved in cell wall biosynthesis